VARAVEVGQRLLTSGWAAWEKMSSAWRSALLAVMCVAGLGLMGGIAGLFLRTPSGPPPTATQAGSPAVAGAAGTTRGGAGGATAFESATGESFRLTGSVLGYVPLRDAYLVRGEDGRTFLVLGGPRMTRRLAFGEPVEWTVRLIRDEAGTLLVARDGK